MPEPRKLAALVSIVLGVLAAGLVPAEESAVTLKNAPGRDAVHASCLACHSADYIVMNSPFLDEKGWRASVAKMMNVMGAPITPEQAEVIVRYLAASYGAPPR